MQDSVRGTWCDDRVCVAMHQCPGVAFEAINARYTQIKLRYFVSSSKLCLPVFYVEEDCEIGCDVPGEGLNSCDTPIPEPGSG